MPTRTPEQETHIRDVAEAIRTHEDRFGMAQYGVESECGAVMCIAGWSAYLQDKAEWSYNHDRRAMMMEPEPTFDAARDAMGLTVLDADQLFLAGGIGAANQMPEHLRAKGIADALDQIADGATVEAALADVAERYV